MFYRAQRHRITINNKNRGKPPPSICREGIAAQTCFFLPINLGKPKPGKRYSVQHMLSLRRPRRCCLTDDTTLHERHAFWFKIGA